MSCAEEVRQGLCIESGLCLFFDWGIMLEATDGADKLCFTAGLAWRFAVQ